MRYALRRITLFSELQGRESVRSDRVQRRLVTSSHTACTSRDHFLFLEVGYEDFGC
jgi:hypothetical protein